MSLQSCRVPFVRLALAAGALSGVAACTDRELALSVDRTPITLADRIAACSVDPRVVAGTVSVDICVGADLFFRETFGGNGRSCATCHPVANNFTIDPPFIATLPPTDPLFIAETNPDLSGLEIPAQMRARSLILENVDGFDPDPTVRFVLRSVPHNLSMGVTVTRSAGDTIVPPVDRTGWSGDGAPGAGALRDFQTGAIIQHYTRSLERVEGPDFRLATDGELDRIDLYMRNLGRMNELNLASVTMSDAGAEAGRALFLTVGCNFCHQDLGANAALGGLGNQNFDTGVEGSRNPALAGFPRDGGFLVTPDGAGGFGDGRFNTPPLVEAADTGPFFHTDTSITGASAHNTPSATTIEEAIAFYDTAAFNNSPTGIVVPIDLTPAQINQLARLLRAVNAAFNAQMAAKRVEAARALILAFGNGHLALQREMLRLARVEVVDAIEVLLGQPHLNLASVAALVGARGLIDEARATSSVLGRMAAVLAAREALKQAHGKLGMNLAFQIGDGTVMF